MKSPKYTPWGFADSIKPLGTDGIYFATTPSHGGFFVPDSLLASIPAEHQARAQKWSGSRNWFEEDCEWASVAIAFPDLFAAEDLDAARKTIEWRKREASL